MKWIWFLTTLSSSISATLDGRKNSQSVDRILRVLCWNAIIWSFCPFQVLILKNRYFFQQKRKVVGDLCSKYIPQYSCLQYKKYYLENCVLELDSIVSEFSFITAQNFHHLQISNNNQDKKLVLSHKNFKKICNLVKLKTLILGIFYPIVVGVQFKETDPKVNRCNVAWKYFDEVNQLSELTHINLCNFVVTKDGSTIVTTKFLRNLSQKCLANMKTLNIEHCSIGE